MPEFTNTFGIMSVWLAAGYILGSIPFGLLIARSMNLGNLREIGSGNIGATNVLRTGNKTAAVLTLLFDAGKGAVAVLLAGAFAGQDAAQLSGFAALLGHCFPVWLRFRGGKGVATYFGLLFALSLTIGALAGIVWLVIAFLSRYSSLAALGAVAAAPLMSVAVGQMQFFVLAVVLAVVVVFRHYGNVRRLISGTETKIGAKG